MTRFGQGLKTGQSWIRGKGKGGEENDQHEHKKRNKREGWNRKDGIIRELDDSKEPGSRS